MSLKKELKEVDALFQMFLAQAQPYIEGKNKKAVRKHLNRKFQAFSTGKAKNLVKRVEKDFGVSLAEQYKAIERSERGSWNLRLSKKR